MVCHEDPSMHGYAESGGAITDTVSKRSDIIIAGEANVSVVSTLDDVNSMTSRAESWWARHWCIVSGILCSRGKPKDMGIA